MEKNEGEKMKWNEEKKWKIFFFLLLFPNWAGGLDGWMNGGEQKRESRKRVLRAHSLSLFVE